MAEGAEDERRSWLALHRAPGIGGSTSRRLVDRFGGAQAVLHASAAALRAAGIDEVGVAYLKSPEWAAVDADLEWLRAPDHHLLVMTDPDYPEPLREIPDPPPLLFVHGDPATLNRPQLAIVGSRNPSPAGGQLAFEFASALAEWGLTITSGLARGIDAAAHTGALAVKGTTIAVAGTGADRVYPASQRELALRIAETGAIVSELPLNTPAIAQNFPRRNRIITGLCVGTLVVEAGTRSGSLISARHAMDQGREVFAIPGSIHNPMARGCHALIRQGAKLVETLQDIVEELGPALARAPNRLTGGPDRTADGEPLDDDYQRLLDCLGFDPTSVDTLVARSGLTANAVSSMLLILELQGYVGSQAGGVYVRKRTR